MMDSKKTERARASHDSKDTPRLSFYIKEIQNGSHDSTMKDAPRHSFSGGDGPRSTNSTTPRASVDGREIARASIDIKDIVRASFYREKPRVQVDGRETLPRSNSVELRESPRFGGGLKFKEAPRLSVDGKEGRGEATKASVNSPRLSARLKEAVRAAVEGRGGDSAQAAADIKETIRNATLQLRESSRSSIDSRLHVELRESPRLSKDAPRYSCDGRDMLRSSLDTCKDPLCTAGQRGRESPRLSVDGRRESPRVAHELYSSMQTKEPSPINTCYEQWRPELDGRDAPSGELRRRVPNLVARLMGLEDLPDDQPASLTPAPLKKPSKEAKLLKGLLQYTPRNDSKSPPKSPPRDFQQRERQSSDSYRTELSHTKVKQISYPSHRQRPGTVPDFHTGHMVDDQATWRTSQEDDRHLKLSPKHLALETMPPSLKLQDAKNSLVFRQKASQSMPKQLSEAVLTVLKHSDESKYRTPMSHEDMETRLRQLRLRSSLQEHKSLRQILEAMQLKGLLNAPSQAKQNVPDMQQAQETTQQHESRWQTSSKQIVLPKSEDYFPDASKLRTLQDLKKLSSRLQEQVFASMALETMKPARFGAHQPVIKASSNLEQLPQSEASIVVMKPIAKQTHRVKAQSPTIFSESMPIIRSPRGHRENGVKGGNSAPIGKLVKGELGCGVGQEHPTRFNCEENLTFKQRKEKGLARTRRDVQSEPTTPRSPKLIALPQTAAKMRSSIPKELAELTKQPNKVSASAVSKALESGRRVRSSWPKEKEDNSKHARGTPLKSQSSRDLLGRKKANVEIEPTKVLRRSASDGKMSPPLEREASKASTGATELTVIRSKLPLGRIRTASEAEARSSLTRKASASKDSVQPKSANLGGERTKTKDAAQSPSSQNRSTTPSRAILKQTPVLKQEEQGLPGPGLQVRVIDGEATDQSSIRTPLVGLTNRLHDPELNSVDHEQRENQGVKTPRGGLVMKKMQLTEQDGDLITISNRISEQPQPSPISVLDGAAFSEDDLSPLAICKSPDSLTGPYDVLENDSQGTSESETSQDLSQSLAQQLRHMEDDHPKFQTYCTEILPPENKGRDVLLRNPDEERIYVRDILVVSHVIDGTDFYQSQNPIDVSTFHHLQEGNQKLVTLTNNECSDFIHSSVMDGNGTEREAADRRLLSDCVNDVLAEIIHPYVNSKPWMVNLCQPSLRKRPSGQKLVQAVWDKLASLTPQDPCEDICDSIYTILQRDLAQPSNSWTNLSCEMGEVGLDIECMIFKDLIDETLADMLAFHQMSSSILPRRQLFSCYI